MTLFKTERWWNTECGANETYDKNSLVLARLFEPHTDDVIIIGSHSGYLRIYKPSSQMMEDGKSVTGFKSTDLVIETKLVDCIVDLNVGKFVSGSQGVHLAVLSPSKLTIYSAVMNQASTEDVERCKLSAVYEHTLTHFPASLVIGPFGGVEGRDFICVQSLDGTLLFYEQESYTFSQNLTNHLLPSPLVYISRIDAFVTLNSSWMVECYRYQNIAEFGRNKDKRTDACKSLDADWHYNLGEPILDMAVVTLTSFEVGIIILGERNLHCLRDNSTLKYTKRLEFNVMCFHPYVIEPDGKLMVMLVTDTSTLMVYEGTTLRWSAQLLFIPVALTRGHFQHLDGVIIILSEEGRLEGCYLGTEPSLFIAPPVNTRGFDYAEAEKELVKLREILQKKSSSDELLSTATAESELNISLSASPHLEQCPVTNEFTKDVERHSMCRLSVELTPYAPLQHVQVTIDVPKPLTVMRETHEIANLCDRYGLQTLVYMTNRVSPVSLEAQITVTYETTSGTLKVLQKRIQIPLKLILHSCPPENNASFATTIKSNDSVLNFSQLFPEFIREQTLLHNNSALGLQNMYNGAVVTIISGATSNRYRLQSNDSLAVTLVACQLLTRLKDHSSKTHSSSISQIHLQLLNNQIDAHFASRQKINKLKESISLLATQLKNIEKMMLHNFREKTTRSLVSLTALLDDTYQMMFALFDQLMAAKMEQERVQHNLYCAVRLLLLLLKLNINDDKYVLLESAIGFVPQLHNDIGWEEMADAALANVLRATSRKSEHNVSRAGNKLERIKDISKLKKRIVHLVERLNKEGSSISENESGENYNAEELR